LADESTPQWIAVAHLLRPQGRRGELLAEPLTDLPGVLKEGRQAWLSSSATAPPSPSQTHILIEGQWSPLGRNVGRVVLKLAGSTSISDAEQLAGKYLLLPTSDLPTLDEDTFFVADLLGCILFDGPTEVGRIIDVQFPIASDGRTRIPDAAPLLVVEHVSPTSGNRQLLANEATEEGESEATDDDSEGEDNNTVLIPFIRAWLDTTDLPNKRIVMHLPEGLADIS
jgi:16S rRNA processing protein RimM